MHGMVGMCVLVHNFHAAQVLISDPFIKRGLRLFLQAALTVMKRCMGLTRHSLVTCNAGTWTVTETKTLKNIAQEPSI
jgi:succinate dehydrogenase hydrophobic anchor subunit